MRKTDFIVVDSLAQKMMAKSNVLDSIGRFCREGEAEIGRKRSRCLAAVSATRSKQSTKSNRSSIVKIVVTTSKAPAGRLR